MNVAVAPAELVRGRPATVRIVATDSTALVLDPGEVNVTIARFDGTTLFAGAASGSGAQPRTVQLSATALATLDQLTVRAEAASFGSISVVVPVVGNELFRIDEARAFDQQQLADPVRFPDDVIVHVRARIREAFTNVTRVRFVEELVRVTVDGDGRDELLLPDAFVHALRRVRVRESTAWRELTSDELSSIILIEEGFAIATSFTWPVGRAAVELIYEAGMRSVPHEVRRAALKLATSYLGLLSSNLPDRALSLSDELGTFRLATPGVGGSIFGLPEVDAVLQRYSLRIPGVA